MVTGYESRIQGSHTIHQKGGLSSDNSCNPGKAMGWQLGLLPCWFPRKFMEDSPEEGSSVKIPGSYLCPEMAEKALGLQNSGLHAFYKDVCLWEGRRFADDLNGLRSLWRWTLQTRMKQKQEPVVSGKSSTKIENAQTTLSRICWPGRSSVRYYLCDRISERKLVR